MRQVDYKNGKIFSNVMQSMLPMLVAQVLSLLYSIVDRIYIGRIPGEGTFALGGVGLCFPIIIMVTAFTNLFGLGGAPLCSIARGQGSLRRASEVMNTAFSMLVLTGVIITAAGELFAAPLLRLFGATDGNLPHALAYLHIYLLGTIFTMLATGLNPYINAQGFASTGMFTVVIGAVTNILLDPLFIFVFGLGVRGACSGHRRARGCRFRHAVHQQPRQHRLQQHSVKIWRRGHDLGIYHYQFRPAGPGNAGHRDR